MGSTRLPGKTLQQISGKPLVQHIIERTRACSFIDEIIVATTDGPEDLCIIPVAQENLVGHFVGNKNDVLDRYFKAAQSSQADIIVRITGDDPFVDPEIMGEFVQHFLDNPGLDIVVESLDEPTYPEGATCSVISFNALTRAWREARLSSEREHVVPYIIKHPGLFKIAFMLCHKPLNHLRWTIDYPEDLEFVRAVYERLSNLEMFFMKDVLNLLENEPELAKINQGHERNSGYRLSLLSDQELFRDQSAA